MMVALGISRSCAALQPLCALASGGLAVICAGDHLADSPRARIDLQLRGSREMPVFLPFAPALQLGSDPALDWCAAHCAEIETALDRVQDGRQITVTCARATPDASKAANGADWLRQRAGIAKAQTVDADALRAGIQTQCGDVPLRALAGDHAPGMLRFHLLVGAEDTELALDRLRAGLPGACGALTVTGPWPAYHFADLGGTA